MPTACLTPAYCGPACCIADGRTYFNTLDNHAIVVDVQSGKEAWRTKFGDINAGETMTMSPLVVKDRVLVE